MLCIKSMLKFIYFLKSKPLKQCIIMFFTYPRIPFSFFVRVCVEPNNDFNTRPSLGFRLYVGSHKLLDRFMKKKKEEEEKAYGNYDDWGVLCENSEELNRFRVPELEKYLNHHGTQHRGRKLSKKDKVRLIVRYWNSVDSSENGNDENEGDVESDSGDGSGSDGSRSDESGDEGDEEEEDEGNEIDNDEDDISEIENEDEDVILAVISDHLEDETRCPTKLVLGRT